MTGVEIMEKIAELLKEGKEKEAEILYKAWLQSTK